MNAIALFESSRLKVANDDLEMEFEVDLCVTAPSTTSTSSHTESIAEEIASQLDAVHRELLANSERIFALGKKVDRLTSNADSIDYLVAAGSGVLAGVVDSLWVGEFDFKRGKAWSNHTVNDFVMKVAKWQGYPGERLDGAIKHLEGKYKIPSDNIWKGKDIGVSAKSHHLDDLAHHPTPIGLFFSILTQFTKDGYFQNSDGDFIPIRIENGELIGADIPYKIVAGTVNWFFHLVSDMSGSNKTAGVGMGIPGPIISLLKEAATIPGLNKTGLAKKMKDIFVTEKFDLRSEMAVGHELARQAMPVIMNEAIVRAFYFIRRLLQELREKKSLEKIAWNKTLPWNNRTIARMLTIATGTFTAVDLADATIRGAIKAGFQGVDLKEFILRVNYVGVCRFAMAVGVDAAMGVKRENRRNERLAIFSEQLHLHNAKVYYLQAEAWIAAETTAQTINDAMVMMEKSAIVFAESWKANEISLVNIGDCLNGVEKHNPGLIEEICDNLK